MKPILFNTEMVKAILAGRKTVTRRLVKSKSKNACGFYVTCRKSDGAFMGVYDYDENEIMCDKPQTPPYEVNDILYVRETWMTQEFYEDEALIRFRAGGENPMEYENGGEMYNKLLKFASDKWNPSLFMPKEVARLFLRVTNVSVERLQDITEEQAKAEGAESVTHPEFGDVVTAKETFEIIWNGTIKKDQIKSYGWEANPYVWVIEFEVIPQAAALEKG